LEFLIVLAILLAVIFVVSAPLRREALGRRPGTPDGETRRAPGAEPVSRHRELITELAELEAARDAKYREIRDAELDFRTGKLSAADYEALDQGLRATAIEILRELDAAQARTGATIVDR
jgi:hypothetical protein